MMQNDPEEHPLKILSTHISSLQTMNLEPLLPCHPLVSKFSCISCKTFPLIIFQCENCAAVTCIKCQEKLETCLRCNEKTRYLQYVKIKDMAKNIGSDQRFEHCCTHQEEKKSLDFQAGIEKIKKKVSVVKDE